MSTFSLSFGTLGQNRLNASRRAMLKAFVTFPNTVSREAQQSPLSIRNTTFNTFLLRPRPTPTRYSTLRTLKRHQDNKTVPSFLRVVPTDPLYYCNVYGKIRSFKNVAKMRLIWRNWPLQKFYNADAALFTCFFFYYFFSLLLFLSLIINNNDLLLFVADFYYYWFL